MIRLTNTLSAWGSAEFSDTLTAEVEQLRHEQLPLQQGLARSSHVSDEPFKAIVIDVRDDADCIKVKLGILYAGVIAGCSCADDPTPLDTQTEYCTLLLTIDKSGAETTVALLSD